MSFQKIDFFVDEKNQVISQETFVRELSADPNHAVGEPAIHESVINVPSTWRQK